MHACRPIFIRSCDIVSIPTIPLRKYEVVETLTTPQDWKIETRKRLTGKLKGQEYKVFVDPEGCKHYSFSKAQQAGFDGECPDGRKKRAKAKAKPRAKKAPKKD